jgi:hypothetical protein
MRYLSYLMLQPYAFLRRGQLLSFRFLFCISHLEGKDRKKLVIIECEVSYRVEADTKVYIWTAMPQMVNRRLNAKF